MKNPFRSEADAYRFVLLTIVYFGAIAIAAAVGGLWPGIAVFIVMTVLAVAWIMRGRREQPPRTAHASRSAPDERRILVIANETVGGRVLRDCIRKRADEYRERVLVVAPALNTPLKHWTSDEDDARDAARPIRGSRGAAAPRAPRDRRPPPWGSDESTRFLTSFLITRRRSRCRRPRRHRRASDR